MGESPAFRDGKPQAFDEKCETCIFRPGNAMRLPPGRLAEVTLQNRQAGAVLTCHKTTYGQHPEIGPTACRGFLDAYPDTLAAEFAVWAFGGWALIPPPHRRSTEEESDG